MILYIGIDDVQVCKYVWLSFDDTGIDDFQVFCSEQLNIYDQASIIQI